MNTTYKGNILENILLKYITQLIRDGGFIASEKNCTVVHQKKFFSKERDGDITFDVVVEIRLPGNNEPSEYWCFECKNYNKNVSSDKIEAFSNQVRQIGQNIKPVIVTTNGLQESAKNYAKNVGIGLWKLNLNNTFDLILPRKTLLNNSTNNDKLITYYSENGTKNYFNSIGEFLVFLGIIKEDKISLKHISFPFIRNSSIEESIYRAESYIYKNERLDKEKLCTYLNEKYGIEFDFNMEPTFDSQNNEIIGKTYINTPKISISKSLVDDIGRFRFTLAHEIGHFILHRKKLQDRCEHILDDATSIGLHGEEIVDSPSLEYQANLFAKELLMPKASFQRLIERFFIKERIYEKYLYVDHQPQNQRTFRNLQFEISTYFGVSQTAARNRLRDLRYIKYDIDQMSIF